MIGVLIQSTQIFPAMEILSILHLIVAKSWLQSIKNAFSFLFPANSSAPSIIEGICYIIGRKKAAHLLRQNEGYKFP